jgi:hypothetical protein
MENFIAELETERIKKQETCLVATGLKDYTLTSEEQQLLIIKMENLNGAIIN